MLSMINDAAAIFGAFLENDAWTVSAAMKTNGVWLFGLIVTLFGGAFMVSLYRLVPFIDRHLERSVMVWTYLIISAVIFIEVFRRFILKEQAPWSTTLPPFLFLIMTWFGCAYNIRLRTHLAFAEVRVNLPRLGQMLCLTLDTVLWLGFCWVVIVTSTKVTANSAANFQILLGTDNVMQWWFLITVPFAFVLMAGRVIENWLKDFSNYRSGNEIITQAVIGGEA